MNPLVRSLLRPEAYDPPEPQITLLETHISWLFLAGAHAYKVKKPVNFGFLDFSTPARRAEACATELRLNRRLNSDLYLAVVPIHGPQRTAAFHGGGPVIERAVKMRRFDQDQLLPAVLARGELTAEAIDALAGTLADFHGRIPVAPPDGPHGTPEAVCRPMQDNLTTLERLATESAGGITTPARLAGEALPRLGRWAPQQGRTLGRIFERRLREGAVRECHGDLHLGNMYLQDGRVRVFDCLEFSADLRWIDVISEMAFLAMDLEVRGAPSLATRLLNRWLEACGDYDGLRLWGWYRAYRALVRAKVTALRLESGREGMSGAARRELLQQTGRYLTLALQSTRRPRQGLILMHGVSGSGKSWLSARLCEAIGAVRLSSDMERKRAYGLWGQPARGHRPRRDPPPPAGPGKELYRPEVSRWLFERRLPALMEGVVAGGFPLVIDATFLRHRDREAMGAFASERGLPMLIVSCRAPTDTLRRRIRERIRVGNDPSDADVAVMEEQLAREDPLSAAEGRICVPFGAGASPEAVIAAVGERLGLQGASGGPPAAVTAAVPAAREDPT